MRSVIWAGLVVVFGTLGSASAGLIAVVADVNADTPGNQNFFDAVLGGGTNVLFSRSVAQQGFLQANWNALPGVTAGASGGVVNAALLDGVDLFVVTTSFNNALDYTPAEIAAMNVFVDGGGSILAILESNSPIADGYNDLLLGIGSSISYTGDRFGVAQNNIPAEATSLGALDPFQVSAYNTLSGGSPVYIANEGTVVAIEDVSGQAVPEPSSVALLAVGTMGLILARRRRRSIEMAV